MELFIHLYALTHNFSAGGKRAAQPTFVFLFNKQPLSVPTDTMASQSGSPVFDSMAEDFTELLQTMSKKISALQAKAVGTRVSADQAKSLANSSPHSLLGVR